VTESERLSDALLVGSTEIAAAHRIMLSRFPDAKLCALLEREGKTKAVPKDG